MVYLDNAATTYPKPKQVYSAWSGAMSAFGANPGRSGHPLSVSTSRAVYRSRSRCAGFFGAEPENTVFTLNCTHALNMAIKGLMRPRAHFVISDIEHNAVYRPVHSAARQCGGGYTLFETSPDPGQTISNAERAIKSGTAALVCTAAGNVAGQRLPLKELAQMCRRKGVCMIVDAAQGAGVLPISLKDGINIICAAGHKGLYGPMGTGLLITDGSYPLSTIIEGGTGSLSDSPDQPDFLPDRLESGTINTAGVIALGAGVDFVESKTAWAIYEHEMGLCRYFCAELRGIKGITVYSAIDERPGDYAPLVSFNIDGLPSVKAAEMLGEKGFYMRGGLHCAPLGHRKLGTSDGGTVRFAPSVFTRREEVYRLIDLLKNHR